MHPPNTVVVLLLTQVVLGLHVTVIFLQLMAVGTTFYLHILVTQMEKKVFPLSDKLTWNLLLATRMEVACCFRMEVKKGKCDTKKNTAKSAAEGNEFFF